MGRIPVDQLEALRDADTLHMISPVANIAVLKDLAEHLIEAYAELDERDAETKAAPA